MFSVITAFVNSRTSSNPRSSACSSANVISRRPKSLLCLAMSLCLDTAAADKPLSRTDPRQPPQEILEPLRPR